MEKIMVPLDEVEKLIINTEEIRGAAFRALMDKVRELGKRERCRGCMGAAFNDCDICDRREHTDCAWK